MKVYFVYGPVQGSSISGVNTELLYFRQHLGSWPLQSSCYEISTKNVEKGVRKFTPYKGEM